MPNWKRNEKGKRGWDAIIAVRRDKALELRQQGMSYFRIAEALGVSKATAYQDVLAVIEETKASYTERAESIRDMEVRRLDRLLFAIWEKAEAGEYSAIDRALKIMERKAKFLGLDAPEKAMIKSEVDQNINVNFEEKPNVEYITPTEI